MSEPTSIGSDSVEQWRPVVGFEDWYSVSNLGRVRREAYDRFRRNTHPGRILKPSVHHKHERLGVVLVVNGKRYPRDVHKLVAEAFIGPCPDGMEVNHKGNHQDNRASMLEYVTHLENIRYDWARGHRTGSKGERNGIAKFTESDVRVIRAELANGSSLAALGRRFKVTYQAIAHVRDRRNWGHLD